MEGSNEAQNVIPELYFLIAKFLSGGPLKETAKTLLKELESVEVLPRRLDWEGNEHPQSYQELDSQYSDMSWRRLASVCERALQLARIPPSLSLTTGEQSVSLSHNIKLNTRLSLLADSLVRPKIKYSAYKQDQSIVRRVISREAGTSPASVPSGRPALSMFPPRLLSALQLQRRTLGHLSAVYCLVFDCTGRYVVTGADDLLVKVWHAADGRLLSTLRGAGAEITDVCVCSTAELVACGSVEKLVRVWCLATGAPRAVLHAHQGTITSVHWAPTGGGGGDVRWLASTSTDGSVAFWACARDGQFLSRPVQYVERMRPGACHMICAAWSAGGAFLAAGSADHHVRVYSLHAPGEHPKRVLEIAVHTEAVDSIAWAHRGLRFVSGSKDGSAALWTLHATQWRHVLLRTTTDPAKRLKVTMVCWDVSDAYVITAVSDHSIRVWDSRTCQQVRVLTGHKDEAYVLEAHPILPGVLLSAGHDGQLFVWNAHTGETLARFHNHIEGQGDGAIFDAKWGASGVSVAASDSHGHLLLLGLGAGHPRLQQLPTELFFHTDYRPLARDALGGALDEQTETPPHLMPPPFLVDVEGAPHAPEYQRLVPGRENLTLSQLIPAAEARSRLDELIEALAGGGEARGVWRGEGVRHTAGSWQRGEPLDATCTTRPIVRPLPQAVKDRIEETSRSQFVWEQAWWRREMRRRPVMISTATDAAPRPAPRRRPAPRPAPRTIPRVDEEPVEESGSDDTSDESVRLSGRSASRSTRSSHSTLDLTDDSSSQSPSKSGHSSSSQYSDWEAGAALAPPARARRRPIPKSRQRYSPSPHTPTKRPERAATSAATETSPVPETSPAAETSPAPVRELPEQYRPGEWITAVSPRKAPYHPQMGDHCLYFRLGHQRYFEAVSEKDIYKVNPRDKPWERTQIHECELVKVVGVKYVIKPPRVVCLKLACALGAPRSFTVRYHDMPDVIDFLVLKQQYAAAVARGWKKGDRFRCMIDDSWWTGSVLSSSAGEEPGGLSGGLPQGGPGSDAARWGAAAARHFLALQVRWDNGEVERLSPWDLEPIDPDRLPAEPGGCVAVLPHELEATLYRAEPHEWPPRGDRASACRAIAQHIGQVMSLSVAEPFVAPVDLQLYPSYAIMIPYPIDLSTIRARFDNLFYRRTAAAQFDVRYLASNAEQFNKPHSPIVRQARLVTDLLLHIISHWREVDVLAKYHELAASYHSSDDEPLATTAANKVSKWREHCTSLLRELMSSADAEPFREPVSLEQAPDYYAAVARPMDLGLVMRQLASGVYSRPEDVAADVRLVFANSRLYNTKPRSRIYTMTVRLSALFEALWSRRPQRPQRPRATDRSSRRPRRRERSRPKRNKPQREVRRDVSSGSSSSEPLSAVKRRDAIDTPAAHSKGKGIGKKSKSSRSSPQPGPSTSAALYDDMEQYANGVPSGSEGSGGDHLDTGPLRLESAGSAYTDVEVLEEELQGDAELEYRPPRPLRRDSGSAHRSQSDVESRSRKRRRRRSSSDSNRRRNRRPKRTRERFASVPSTSSGSASGSGSGPDGGRYESDRSYRPRYSTDDDAPLHLYRQRQEDNSTEAGPSTSRRHHKHSRKSRLRARSPRRYNEESEDDAAAAISKRVGGARSQRPHHHAQRASASNHTDHNYHNGHAAAHNGRVEDPSTGAVSISSRGRVRRLTAKARGLLRE